jgi:hypothetical protein
MAIVFAENYQNANTSFPSDRVDLDKKMDEEYYKQCAKSIAARYIKNACAIPYAFPTGKRSIWELRAYARGENSIQKYKDWIIGKKPNSGNRIKTSLNISWDIAQVIPQFVDDIMGYFKKFDFDPVVSALDPQAEEDRNLAKARAKLFISEEFKKFQFISNFLAQSKLVEDKPNDPNTPPVQFNTEEEIDFYDKIGGFILTEEAAIKTLLDLSNSLSNWNEIKSKLFFDLITARHCAIRTYSDKGSSYVKYKYVDLEGLVFPHSEYNDYRDITYAGEIRKVSIAELRSRYGVPENILYDMAKKYTERMGGYIQNSTDWNNFRSKYYDSPVDNRIIDSVLVDVIECCWISTDYQKMTLVNRPLEGNTVINKVKLDYNLKERDARKGKEIKEYAIQTLYECAMVLGYDYVIDYGKPNNISYKEGDNGQPEVIFPYQIAKIETSSIVERCIPYADDIQLAYLKFRNALKKMIPAPGMIINRSALTNVSLDGKTTASEEMLLQALTDEGVLVISNLNQFNEATGANTNNVIQFIPDRIFEMVQGLEKSIALFYNQMKTATGINDLFASNTPSAETAVGVAKISISSAENSLYSLLTAYQSVYERGMNTAVKMWKIIDTHLPKNKKIPLFVSDSLKTITLGGALSYDDINVTIKAGFNNDAKNELKNIIVRFRDVRAQTGKGGLTMSDFFMINQVIDSGNIAKAQLLIAQKEEIQRLKDLADSQQQMNMNAQVQGQSLKQNQDFQLQLQQLKNQGEATMEALKQQAENQRQTQKLVTEFGNQAVPTKGPQPPSPPADNTESPISQPGQDPAQLALEQAANQNVYGKGAGDRYFQSPYNS